MHALAATFEVELYVPKVAGISNSSGVTFKSCQMKGGMSSAASLMVAALRVSSLHPAKVC